MSDTVNAVPVAPKRKPRRWPLFLLLLAILCVLWPLGSWQHQEQREAVGLNNLRRLGQGTLLYSQDWDDRPMPPALAVSGAWRTWPEALLPYLGDRATLDNPLNPLQKNTVHPTLHYPILSGYALNSRFYNTFGTGTYPLDNLELPYRTVLFVEAGPMWAEPLRRPKTPVSAAVITYDDISDTVNGLSPYPAPHGGKIAVVAADGHAETLTVAHYPGETTPHDKRYGRIGGTIYNWNGGFPAGETDTPPHE